ncbi:MAG: bifunctional glutamate N-acetyltransferase/amino-acid acetyltransferase ArgJ [Actinomycetota bacterium]|nr:bifunctional glutamate N-acetyltransferase/amino-acid acetyltransferase ArgJ [Actinomycetota bacterium]
MSVTEPAGFVASGVWCGVKASPSALDLALVATEDGQPVPAAAVFTANKACAAPVQVSRAHLAASGGRAAAVVLNSGNANAATGADGNSHAEETCALVASGLGCAAEEVLVCSTGLIGIPLPIDAIKSGIGPLVGARAADRDSAATAARAMMTTDTVLKETVIAGGGFTVGGMAKGAAMLAPHMATMLAVLTTDATASPADLHHALTMAVDSSFNQITVDGSMSTNDTVIVLASGRAATADGDALAGPLTEACSQLAAAMVADAEGATKLIEVRVTGAASADEARRAARRVAEAQLVKCSFFGHDPYWGRVVSELGSAGVEFELDRVSVAYGGIVVCQGGVAVAHDHQAVTHHLAQRNVEVTADLGVGHAAATILTADLTPSYIDENMTTS